MAVLGLDPRTHPAIQAPRVCDRMPGSIPGLDPGTGMTLLMVRDDRFAIPHHEGSLVLRRLRSDRLEGRGAGFRLSWLDGEARLGARPGGARSPSRNRSRHLDHLRRFFGRGGTVRLLWSSSIGGSPHPAGSAGHLLPIAMSLLRNIASDGEKGCAYIPNAARLRPHHTRLGAEVRGAARNGQSTRNPNCAAMGSRSRSSWSRK